MTEEHYNLINQEGEAEARALKEEPHPNQELIDLLDECYEWTSEAFIEILRVSLGIISLGINTTREELDNVIQKRDELKMRIAEKIDELRDE